MNPVEEAAVFPLILSNLPSVSNTICRGSIKTFKNLFDSKKTLVVEEV